MNLSQSHSFIDGLFCVLFADLKDGIQNDRVTEGSGWVVGCLPKLTCQTPEDPLIGLPCELLVRLAGGHVRFAGLGADPSDDGNALGHRWRDENRRKNDGPNCSHVNVPCNTLVAYHVEAPGAEAITVIPVTALGSKPGSTIFAISAISSRSTGQRFLGSNHIRPPRRVCKTMCG
jgi:hypothetical protein